MSNSNGSPLTIHAQGSETGGAAEHGVRCAAFPLPIHPPLIDVIEVRIVELGLDGVIYLVVAGHYQTRCSKDRKKGETETLI
jgi:hypothetical protein